MNSQAVALCVAVGALAGGPVAWSPANAAEPQQTEEIVVRSERAPVRSEAPVVTSEGKTATGMPIVQTEIRHRIRFDDLDLATDAGAAALLTRVREVARKGCEDLDKMYAPAGPDSSCTKTAVSQAMPQVNAAIAGAKAGLSTTTPR